MEEQPYEDVKPRHEEMVTGFLTRWNTSHMTELDRQVDTPDMVIDVDYITQMRPRHTVHPVPVVFQFTEATQTTTDPRSSVSTTYTTVFSVYVPRGSHTVSFPVITEPWTSVSVS